MKRFKQYLRETADRVYEFRIKLSYEPSKEELEKIENVLKSFDLVSMSNPRRIPPEENPADFPAKGPIELHIIDASVRYPVNSVQVKSLMRERAGMDDACFIVRNKLEDEKFMQDYITRRATEPVLTKELEEINNDSSRTDKHMENFLKTLSKKRQTPEVKTESGRNESAKTTNELPPGTQSPVGSTRNKIPDPMEMGRGKTRR